MTTILEKANIITTKVTVPKEETEVFSHWKSEINERIAKFPGFLSLEILSPEALKSPSWTIIQRFTDAKSASVWFESEERKHLLQTTLKVEDVMMPETGLGITEVIITQVAPEKREAYKKWMVKIHTAESKFPGFRGTYVQVPDDDKGHWVTLLQFDNSENLDKWLVSDDRKDILKELDPMITSLETHRVISPFAGWFSSIAKVAEIPPVWKQTMLVLAVLYPMVMLQLKFLNPVLRNLNISLATFIGNIISVIFITWPLMPIVIRLFKFWLTPDIRSCLKTNIKGTLIILGLYLVEILIFWNFFNF